MNPNPQFKRFVGSVILMVIIAVVVPFFISGENINKGREAIALLNNDELRDSQMALDRVEKMQNSVQAETRKIDESLARHDSEMKNEQERILRDQRNNSSSGADNDADPVIVENTTDPAREAELKKQRELQAKVEAEKQRKAELMRKQQQLREREALLQAEKQRRLAEAKAKADKRKAEELARRQSQTITVINGNTNRKTEIPVDNNPPASHKQNNSTDQKILSSGGDLYTIRVGTYSSITNAKNAQLQVHNICSAPMLKPVTINGRRMFKVTCGTTRDLNALRAVQSRLTSVVGQTVLEKVE